MKDALEVVLQFTEKILGEKGKTPLDGLFYEGSKDVNRVAFAVDPSLSTIRDAIRKKADLIITHHNLINEPIAKIDSLLAKRLELLINNKVSIASYHLVLDFLKDHGNFYSLARILGFRPVKMITQYKDITGVTLICKPPKEMSFAELIGYLKRKLKIKVIGHKFDGKPIRKIALSTGGGAKEFLLLDIAKEGADVYITGETSHHGLVCARDLGLNIVFLGHYNSEKFGLLSLKEKMERKFAGIKTMFIQDSTGY